MRFAASPRNIRRRLISEAIDILGYAFEPVVVRADRLGEVIANFVTAAVLFDDTSSMLSLVLTFVLFAPAVEQPHNIWFVSLKLICHDNDI